MKVFIDTNIFLDLILNRENAQNAMIIFNGIEKDIFHGIILDITVLNIDYIAKKQVADIREFLILLSNMFEIVGSSNETIKKALLINNNDLEDNLQYICAEELKCDVIITNDKTFYTKGIETISSTEFVSKYL